MRQEELKEFEKWNQEGEVSSSSDPELAGLFELTKKCELRVDTVKAWRELSLSLAVAKPTLNWLKVAAAITLIALVSVTIFFQITSQVKLVSHVGSSDRETHILPDGSTITLAIGSQVIYDPAFEDRSIELVGTAYFDVVKKKNTFSIATKDANIHVLGTSFLVDSNDDELTVSVASGIVSVQVRNHSQQVTKGEIIYYQSSSNKLTKENDRLGNSLVWKTRTFQFDETPLAEVILLLEKEFDREVKISNEALNRCTVSGQFKTDDLEVILDQISIVLNATYSIKKQQYLISGTGC
ncbi:MAG: transmembrane sensor [Cyclobacteriaceae bacterium]|jgi:transmembrane sensor